MEFLENLSKKLDGKYNYLKVLKVVYDTTFSLCHINFIYPETVPTLTDVQKEQIRTACKEVLNIQSKVECKFNKSFLDENIVKSKISEYFKNNYDSISSCINDRQIDYDKNAMSIDLCIHINQTLYKYFSENDICSKLKKYLTESFCAEFRVVCQEDDAENFDEEDLEIRAMEVQSKIEYKARTPRFKVANVLPVFGGDIMPMPEYMKNLKEEKTSLVLAGTVLDLEQKEFLPRRNKLKGIDEKRKMYKFKLDDGSASVNCIHFCNKNSEKHFVLVEEGSYILCLGDYLKRNNGEMQYLIKAISLCSKSDEVIEYKAVDQTNKDYKYVRPTPYSRMVQNTLFETRTQYPDYIMDNTFVVFDVETTGLVPDKNEITEIGAVKIVNGEITERFQTLCKPHQLISEEITKLTGITNEMVQNEHAPEEIIEDFLLFAGDSIMVGYNVNFDYQFIQFTAKKVDKSFNNEFRDCMGDAKAKLFLPNYRLGTVVNHLGVTLDNAHRALYDATATAEAFLRLSLIN